MHDIRPSHPPPDQTRPGHQISSSRVEILLFSRKTPIRPSIHHAGIPRPSPPSSCLKQLQIDATGSMLIQSNRANAIILCRLNRQKKTRKEIFIRFQRTPWYPVVFFAKCCFVQRHGYQNPKKRQKEKYGVVLQGAKLSIITPSDEQIEMKDRQLKRCLKMACEKLPSKLLRKS